MNLKTGDRVKFLNDSGGGRISSFLDNKTAMVTTSDGFDIPVKIAELIKDSGDFMQNDSQPEIAKPPMVKEKEIPLAKAEDAENTVYDEVILLAVLPGKSGSDLFAHLINNSSYNFHYVITKGLGNSLQIFDHGAMDAGTQMKIVKFLPENLNDIIRLDLQLIFFKTGFFTPRDPVNTAVFLNPSEIYNGKALLENDYFDQKALIFEIADFKKKTGFSTKGGLDVLEDLMEKNLSSTSKKTNPSPKKSSNEPEEVDLHIEAITDNYSGLSNSDILEIQMARFKITLDTALIHKTRRIVFIHGVGNGKLKFSLRKALEDKYPDLQYQDASFKEYGYGATMVIIP